MSTIFTFVKCIPSCLFWVAVIMCDASRVDFKVFVNDIQIYDDNIYYDVGDEISFSCDGSLKNRIHWFIITHTMKATEFLIPPEKTNSGICYNLIADYLDNETSITCTMTGYTNYQKKVTKRLIMKPVSGNIISEYKVIEYNEDKPFIYTCLSDKSKNAVNKKDINDEWKIMEPNDSGMTIFCTINHERGRKNPAKKYFTREIYNKTKFLYVPDSKMDNINNYCSKGYKIGISLGIVLCVALAGVLSFLYFTKNRRAGGRTEIKRDHDPSQVIYADLELSERVVRVPETNDTAYAQVIGVIQKKE